MNLTSLTTGSKWLFEKSDGSGCNFLWLQKCTTQVLSLENLKPLQSAHLVSLLRTKRRLSRAGRPYSQTTNIVQVQKELKPQKITHGTPPFMITTGQLTEGKLTVQSTLPTIHCTVRCKHCWPAFIDNKLIPAVCLLIGPGVSKQGHRQTKRTSQSHCLQMSQNNRCTSKL